MCGLGIELKICMINYLGVCEASKVSHLQTFVVVWGWMKCAQLWGFSVLFLPSFVSTRTGRTAHQTAAPSILKHVFPCKKVPSGGLVDDTLPFGGISMAKKLTLGPKIGNPIIKKIVNNSKTVRDEAKLCIKHQ